MFFSMFFVYRPETGVTASLHDQVDKLEKHLRYSSKLSTCSHVSVLFVLFVM